MEGARVSFADLLFQELRRRNISLRKFAELSGVDQSTFSKIVNEGSQPSPTTIRKVAPFLGKDEDELLSLVGHRSARPAPARPQPLMPVVVPVYDHPVGAGGREPAVQEYMYLPPETTIRPGWYGLPVRGTCMVPRLNPGDVILVNPDGMPDPGDMVVFDMDEEVAMVKWFVKVKGAYFLKPEVGEMIPYDEARIRLVGVVMGTYGKKPHLGRQ